MLKSPPPFFITCFIRSPVNWFSFPPHFSIRTSLSASFHPLLILPSPLFSLYVLNLASCLSLSLSAHTDHFTSLAPLHVPRSISLFRPPLLRTSALLTRHPHLLTNLWPPWWAMCVFAGTNVKNHVVKENHWLTWKKKKNTVNERYTNGDTVLECRIKGLWRNMLPVFGWISALQAKFHVNEFQQFLWLIYAPNCWFSEPP